MLLDPSYNANRELEYNRGIGVSAEFQGEDLITVGGSVSSDGTGAPLYNMDLNPSVDLIQSLNVQNYDLIYGFEIGFVLGVEFEFNVTEFLIDL